MKSPPAGRWAHLRWGKWLTLGASIYVLIVAVTAAVGFITDSTQTILLAALLGFPASLFALPGYYVMYGMLALVPGANPSSNSGSVSCTPDGTCHGFETGDPAPWFPIAADALGIVALSCAGLLNVVVLWLLTAHRRRSTSAAADPKR